jgi:ferritin-like metal-binding protein YciE
MKPNPNETILKVKETTSRKGGTTPTPDTTNPTKKYNSEVENGIRRIFENELKTICWAEKELVKTIPWLIEEVSSEELKVVLQNDLEVKKTQYKRLESIFETLEMPFQSTKCEAVEGLIRDTEIKLNEIANEENVVRDAAIISAVQRIEYYEIATYGTLRAYANALKLDEVADLLECTRREEKEVDEKLTEISEVSLNENATAY